MHNFNQSQNSVHNICVTYKNDWGPKRDPLYIVLPITTVYVVIFFSGVLGNISTCIVIAKNKSLHTATNYYLFSLAISDLLLLTSGLPPEIYSIWSKYPYIFGEEFCLLQGLAAETSANATVLTITAFTVERYVAICFPFLSHKLSKLNRAIKYIIYIWMIAMCLAIPQAISFGVVCEQLDGHLVTDHCICMLKRTFIPHAFEISTVLFFVVPMTLITVLYVLIGLQLHGTEVESARGGSVRMKRKVYKSVRTVISNKSPMSLQECEILEDEGRKNFAKNAQAAKHVVKMLGNKLIRNRRNINDSYFKSLKKNPNLDRLVSFRTNTPLYRSFTTSTFHCPIFNRFAVVVAFFICWAPFQAQRLLAIYGEPTSAHMIKAFKILTYISGVLYYLSTTINPVLYHIMSNKFREAFRSTYKQCCSKKRSTPACKFYSTISARSSQVNSHSSDSCSQSHRPLRYMEAEMDQLQDNRRPLVLSFQKKRILSTDSTARPGTKETAILDLGSVKSGGRPDFGTERHQAIIETDTFCSIPSRAVVREFSSEEVHSLQPEHICPLRKT